MGWFFEYLLFFAETVTIVIAILALLIFILSQRKKSNGALGHLVIKDLNEHYTQVKEEMQLSSMDSSEVKKFYKDLKKQKKREKKAAKQHKESVKSTSQNSTDSSSNTDNFVSKQKIDDKPKLFVLSFDGSVDAHEVEDLRQEITAILAVIKPNDEVAIKLESPGGVVHGYGLAASQLDRFRSRNITLTALVDKVAASGGYMMACTASKIIAAPFAIVGSIGVVAQIPNFHRLLKKHDIDVELQTAGAYKRTLTMFGKNTKEGREKFKQELDETHLLFKDFVKGNRPDVDIDRVATGEHWFATQAKGLNLVDEIGTSDDFIVSHIETHKIISVKYVRRQKLSDKLTKNVVQGVERLLFRHNGLR